ncbi:MAG TPA: kinase-associated lipoprotein B [Bacillota bacterium]|nr:kinase-associated lipoprotein B [Bacillota bacterium]
MSEIGDIVLAHYNSGSYIGEVIEDRGERDLIKVLAVKKHPLQGDIHNYGKIDGVFFHERKALAFHEKMNVKKPAVHAYTEEIPEYATSLKKAVEDAKEKLKKKDTAFNQLSLKTLERLEKETYSHIYDS